MEKYNKRNYKIGRKNIYGGRLFQGNKNRQALKKKKNRVDYLKMSKCYEQAIHKRNENIQ